MNSSPSSKVDNGKFSLLKKIQAEKFLLFSKFKSDDVTSKKKEEAWMQIRSDLISEGYKEFEGKTWKQLRDGIWSTLKSRTMVKRDKAKESGSGGVAKYSEV